MQPGPGPQQRLQQDAVPAADVDDSLAVGPGIVGQGPPQLLPAGRQQAAVASPGLGVVGQVLLPDGAEGGVEGRLAGLGHPQGLGEDRKAALAGGQVGELTGPCGQEVGDAKLGGHEDRLADHEAEDLAGELGPEFSVLIHGGQDGTGIPPRGRGATRNGSLIFGEQVLVVGREPVAEAD